MTLSRRQEEGVSVLRPSGRIGIAEMGQLKSALKRLLDQGDDKVVVDLSYVPDVSWCALGALVEKSKEFKSKKRQFKLAGVNRALKGTLQSVGAARLVDMYETETEALASFDPA